MAHKNIRHKYSKPSGDIAVENDARILKEKELLSKQLKTAQAIEDQEDRSECVLCGNALLGEKFEHRSLRYVICENCGHLQTKSRLPANYPFSVSDSSQFNQVYPSQSDSAFEDRKNRIYRPKLDWIIESLTHDGHDEASLKSMGWLELGSGGGYFLSSLRDFGVTDYYGYDADAGLVERANEHLNGDFSSHTELHIADTLSQHKADIYVSFFVLEHIEETYRFFQALSNLASGSIFVFSVPVFGVSAVLENAFPNNYARSLDNVVHTQMYTETSLDYAMNLAGFEIRHQWTFGQDVDELITMIMANTRESGLSSKMFQSHLSRLSSIKDDLQEVLDKNGLSDQKHFIAIKP